MKGSKKNEKSCEYKKNKKNVIMSIKYKLSYDNRIEIVIKNVNL